MIKKILYIVAFVLFCFIAYLAVDFYSFLDRRDKEVLQKGKETTQLLNEKVDEILTKIAQEGDRLAKLFGENDFTAEEVEQIIKESSLSIPEIQGVTACYEYYAQSAEKKLYCPYYNKGDQAYIFVEDTYDYTIIGKGTAWYTEVRDKGAKWVEPYYAMASKDWYVDYGIPFYYKEGPNKGKIRGTITLSFVCGGFKNLVHSLSLGKTGYGMITSTQGTFLAHPVNEYIGTTKLDSVKAKETRTELIEAYDEILAGKSGHTQFYDEELQDKVIFFYDQIPSAKWGIGLMFFRNDLLGDTISLNHRIIKLSLIFSLFFLVLLAIHYNKDHLDEGEIWRLSLVSSLLLAFNIIFIGTLQHKEDSSTRAQQSPPIVDMATLGKYVNQQRIKADELKTPQLTSVPIGLYIHRMEFEDSYNMNIGGTLWQKYPLSIADEVTIGFSFPQMSPFAEAAYIEEAYRKKIEPKEGEPGFLLVGWDFRVTLRLNLSYADYPLDKRLISIEILPLDNNDHLIFTPDLSSYSYTNPSKKSGMNHKIEISGSEVVESYFSYETETFDTDFGYGHKELFEQVPILHFNINLRRLLLNSFIIYLIPIFVTLIMIFILIYASDKTNERQGIIESMAAFFFVLIFSHIDLRKEIITADLIYIEYFYFATYFMALLATFNLITFTKDKSKIFDYNDNQIFKALYFPIFFMIMLAVTLVKFY